MKIYVIASLIFGLLSGGIFAENERTAINETTTYHNESTTSVETTTSVEISTTSVKITTSVETTATGNVTTSQAPTTPLPIPGPREDPKQGSWVVKSENRTCMMLDAAIQFKFNYEQKDEKFVETYLNVPKNASENESSCDLSVLTLRFGKNSFSLKFVQEDKKVFAKLANLTYYVSEDVFPGAKDLGSSHDVFADNLTLFRVPEGRSYYCKEASTIHFHETNVTGSLTNIKVEAFKNSTSADFSTADECSSDISDIVPIAVGCALAALVIIVLIAYLVGRQRTRQRGYQSV